MKVIHWFRKDLRLADNSALNKAASVGGIIPVYTLSTWKKQHNWTGYKRQKFLCDCLNNLDTELREYGAKLNLIPTQDAPTTLISLAVGLGVEAISFNKDYDPFGVTEEKKLKELAQANNIQLLLAKDRVLHEDSEVKTKAGKPFVVFTPFAGIWNQLPKPKSISVKLVFSNQVLEDTLNTPINTSYWELPEEECDILVGGTNAAKKRLAQFSEHIALYKSSRDVLAGTNSRLSQDLRFGTISIRQVYEKAMEALYTAPIDTKIEIQTFINELAWRDFYMALLERHPEVLTENFNKSTSYVQWHTPDEKFEAFKQGKTGFPVIDAAIRELLHTGFMHNRARMIVAMFLTKDLHIHWEQGEKFFMQHLLDGEIASNNGGWQWSAGTGADAAPYFRIQNPWLQTKRFDRNGEYIKKWVPELAEVNPQLFWNPPKERFAESYPEPIVNHATEKEVTMKLWLSKPLTNG